MAHLEILIGKATKAGHVCALCNKPIEIGQLSAVLTDPPTREKRHVACHLKRARS